MPRITVIIPTRDRPKLLLEAVASVALQTHRDWEIIVIDDGSAVPVDGGDLRAAACRDVVLVRHDRPHGQATARERAEPLASGEFILQLDDDDLLDPTLMACGLEAFSQHKELGVVFLGVAGFGDGAASFELNQKQALGRVLKMADRASASSGLIRFDGRLFAALLHSVPMAFQRPLASRQTWCEVTELRRRVYGSTHPLQPPLRESEWALYAAGTQCVALLPEPLYRQRCSAQGYFSVPRQRAAADAALLDILEHLSRLATHEPLIARWCEEITQARERCHFDQAYGHLQSGERWRAFRHLLEAAALKPRVRQLRLMAQLMLPRTRRREASQPN